jgi:hypothetical protein
MRDGNYRQEETQENPMAERGSDKHGPELDEQMKHEAESGLQGIKPSHVEEFRQSEPFTDDTDSEEVQAAPMRDDQGSGDRPEGSVSEESGEQ